MGMGVGDAGAAAGGTWRDQSQHWQAAALGQQQLQGQPLASCNMLDYHLGSISHHKEQSRDRECCIRHAWHMMVYLLQHVAVTPQA